MLQSKPPKVPLSHLRGIVDLTPNQITTKAEICATPPQNRRRFFIPKHLKSPFGIYKNRSGSGAGSEHNYTFSGKFYSPCHISNAFSSRNFPQKAFFQKNFSGLSSMNSSTNSESALLANSSPTQSITKIKSRDKENKLQRFGGALVNGRTIVFGKIKSLWSHSKSNIGLNSLVESSKSRENLGLESDFDVDFESFALISFVSRMTENFFFLLMFSVLARFIIICLFCLHDLNLFTNSID